ncbi:transposase [Aeribacillus pallidus]|uniref:helix-turn-helix domain-containing protein n=1 Tax=Aeribacillus sp. FSL K6-1305 TaxID=2954569 RepID=UPI00139856DA|nr:transposase [Aeribacillus pallidus]
MAKGKYQEWLTQENLTLLEGWARDGLTDEQIAHNMGIKRQTLYDWKKKYPDISDALKRGKEVVDREVENVLLKRALGYEYEEVKTYIEESDGKKKKRVEKTVKHVPGDVTAQIFWLKNRKPEVWRDKKETELSGGVNLHNPFADLTTEELKKLVEDG